MAHSYAKHKEHDKGRERAHKMFGKMRADGGSVEDYAAPSPSQRRAMDARRETDAATKARGGKVHSDEDQDRKLIKKVMKEEKPEVKAHGGKTKARMDKYARGGKTKGGHKGHHTKINIVVVPKGGGADGPPPPMPMGAPPGAGAAPPAAMMGPPKTPVAPPAGGPMGRGIPPGLGMKRGGGVRPHSGIASPENLKKWSEYAAHGTKYARGGSIHGPLDTHTGGAESGAGRLAEQKYYAKGSK